MEGCDEKGDVPQVYLSAQLLPTTSKATGPFPCQLPKHFNSWELK